MKKKLFLIITKTNFGGAQRYVYDVATHLNSQYDVAVIGGGNGVLFEKLAEKNIRTISMKSLVRDISFIKDIRSLFELMSIFKKEKPDIVHLNSSKIGGIGALAARFAKVPNIIFTGHGWAFNENRPWLQKKIILIVHWITVMLSHTTIAVAEKIKNDINTLPWVSKKIKVIYNGIGDIDFIPRENAREMLGIGTLKPGTLVIGTISELHRNKGLDIALQGFNQFRNNNPLSHFIIVGEGEQRKELETYIRDNNLWLHVTLAGFVKDAARYLKAFDIFTLTSRTEAFPYVPLEAALAHLPVVASKVGGIPELITDRVNGVLVEPSNAGSFFEGLEYITSNTDKDFLSEALYKQVKDNFSHATMIDKLKEVYENPHR